MRSMQGAAATLNAYRWLDRAEQGAVLALYVWLVARMWPADLSLANWFPILLMVSEGLVVVLLLLRRPTDHISRRTADWLIAAAGTFLVLMVQPGGASLSPELALALMLAGLAIHIGAKLSLWRSFGLVAANRGVKTSGLYRFVRHPMYAGYMLSHLGFLISAPSLWNLAVYLTVWLLLVARIQAEERTLRQDAQYAAYAERVRWKLLPGVY